MLSPRKLTKKTLLKFIFIIPDISTIIGDEIGNRLNINIVIVLCLDSFVFILLYREGLINFFMFFEARAPRM